MMLNFFKQYLPFILPLLKYLHRTFFVSKHYIFRSNSRLINHVRPTIRKSILKLFPTDLTPLMELDESSLQELHKKGFTSVENAISLDILDEIQAQMKKIFSDASNLRTHLGFQGLAPDYDFEKNFPSILKLFNSRTRGIIENFYGSKFNLYYISCAYTTFSQAHKSVYELESALWHFDDISRDMMHLIVFLHDTEPKHGATQIFDIDTSKKYLSQGYYNRYYLGDLAQKIENDPGRTVLNSKKGTAHFAFSPICMHKAGMPEPGELRESIIITFRPGLSPSSIQNLGPLKKIFFKFMNWLSEDWKNSGVGMTRKIDLSKVS